MQIKVSDILAMPFLKNSYILNNEIYSNNLIDTIEVLNDMSISPVTNALYILNEHMKIKDENEISNFINLCNEHLISCVIMSEQSIEIFKSLKNLLMSSYCNITIPIIIIADNCDSYKTAFEIQTFISDFYKTELTRIIEVNNSFSHISLKAPNINSIVNYFKLVINNPVSIYDEFFNVIVSTDDYVRDYKEIPGTIEKDFLYNLYFFKQKIIFTSDDVPQKDCIRVLFPITFENRDKAYLAVFEVNTPLSAIDYTILEISATATLVEMKRRLALKSIEEKYVNDFLYDLIYRTDNKTEEIKRRAKILNIEENCNYCAIILDINVKNSVKPSHYEIYVDVDDKISSSISSFIKSFNKQSLVSKFGKSILILHKINSYDVEVYINMKNMCEELNTELIKRYPNTYYYIGIGSIISNINNMSKSYKEAMSSISYGRTIYGEYKGFIISYNDSSLLKIFNKIKETDTLNEIVPENLKELKKFDTDSKSNLFETLSVYLDCNCNAKKASEKMFIHYKTMLYRLDKIIKDFDIDLNNSNSRLQIELGIQVLNIIEMQTGGETI